MVAALVVVREVEVLVEEEDSNDGDMDAVLVVAGDDFFEEDLVRLFFSPLSYTSGSSNSSSFPVFQWRSGPLTIRQLLLVFTML